MWLSDWDEYDAREDEYQDTLRTKRYRRDRQERKALEKARKENANA